MKHPVTPDGRYFVVLNRLWRTTNPALPDSERTRLTMELMSARRDVAAAKRAADGTAERTARHRVDVAKRGLGERGPVWWTDGTPDYNRRMIFNTPYADWFRELDRPLN